MKRILSQLQSTLITVPLFFILTGCSSTPPTKASKELCSGTKRPYQINGITYVPQDHYDYDEEGVASWYGPGFHQRPGSCGSIYNQHALTAAHKTLPIPSVVEVTNIENGRQIKLVVTDRGPFVDTRIIDLSKKAAEELGTHGRGLGKVRVRAIPSESHALATYLKQFGRWGIDPSGRSWDVIYRDHIDGKHHDIKTETKEELVHHVQEETLEQVIYPELQKPKIEHLTYRSDDSQRKVEAKPVNKVTDPQFDKVLEDISKEDSPKKIIKKKGASAKEPAPKEKDSGSYFIQVGSYVQKTNAHTISKELTKYGRTQVVMENTNFYTVQLGPYPSQAHAKKVMGAVTKDGHHGLRITR